MTDRWGPPRTRRTPARWQRIVGTVIAIGIMVGAVVILAGVMVWLIRVVW